MTEIWINWILKMMFLYMRINLEVELGLGLLSVDVLNVFFT